MIKNKKKLLNLAPYFTFFLVSFLMIMFQIVGKATLISGDTMFHFNRFYDIKQQLATGNFSLFQTNYAFNQSGRVINAVYGPMFAYFNGFLVLITKNWFQFQIITNFIILMLGSIGMYQLLLKVNVDTIIATILSVFFINIGLIPTWIDNSSFNSWGAAIAPYALSVGLDMILNHNKPINWIKLMLVMSIIAQIHVLSTVIIAVALIPLFVLGISKTIYKKQMWLETVKAVLGTLVLTANVWGALLVLRMGNVISSPGGFNLTSFAVTPSKVDSLRSHLGLPMLIIIVFQICYLLLKNKKFNLNLLVSLEGFAFLFVSSKYFPWNYIQMHFPTLRRNLQFPSRLLIIAYPLILVGVGLSISALIRTNINWLKAGIYGFTLILMLGVLIPEIKHNKYLTMRFYDNNNVIVNDASMYHSVVSDRSKIRMASQSHDKHALLTLFTQQQPDYLPQYGKVSNKTADDYYVEQIINRQHKFKHQIQKNGVMKLSWKAKEKGKTILPIIVYRESILKVNNSNAEDVHKSLIGAPTVKQRRGFNTVYLYFKVPKLMYFFLIMSFVGWILILIKIIFMRN